MPHRRPRRPGRRGRWLRAVAVAAVVSVVVVLLLGLVSMMQRTLIYFPDRSTPPPAAQVVSGARDVTLHTEDDLELTAWLVPAAPDADTGMSVLYLPGNGGNRTGRVQIAGHLSERGLTVLLMAFSALWIAGWQRARQALRRRRQ